MSASECEHELRHDGMCLTCGVLVVKRGFGDGWPWWKNLLLVAVALVVLFALLMVAYTLFGQPRSGAGRGRAL
jgi:hypothetical protein